MSNNLREWLEYCEIILKRADMAMSEDKFDDELRSMDLIGSIDEAYVHLENARSTIQEVLNKLT